MHPAPIVKNKVKKATDAIFREPISRFAREYASSGGETYHYDFHWMEDTFLGSCHGCELGLLFGPKGIGGRLEREFGLSKDELSVMGRPLRDIWAGFIRDGTIRTNSVKDMIDIERL